jgi:hypothetical protein
MTINHGYVIHATGQKPTWTTDWALASATIRRLRADGGTAWIEAVVTSIN